jgi:hypothetical protein
MQAFSPTQSILICAHLPNAGSQKSSVHSLWSSQSIGPWMHSPRKHESVVHALLSPQSFLWAWHFPSRGLVRLGVHKSVCSHSFSSCMQRPFSHQSMVSGILSSQFRGVSVHMPVFESQPYTMHLSCPLQLGLGVCVQPTPGTHSSLVHALLSSHSIGMEYHSPFPGKHLSTKHFLECMLSVPAGNGSGIGECTHLPLKASQWSDVHQSLSSQIFAVAIQSPVFGSHLDGWHASMDWHPFSL